MVLSEATTVGQCDTLLSSKGKSTSFGGMASRPVDNRECGHWKRHNLKFVHSQLRTLLRRNSHMPLPPEERLSVLSPVHMPRCRACTQGSEHSDFSTPWRGRLLLLGAKQSEPSAPHMHARIRALWPLDRHLWCITPLGNVTWCTPSQSHHVGNAPAGSYS